MYDPMTLSQTYGSPDMQFSQVEKKEGAEKPAEAPKKPPSVPAAPGITTDSAQAKLLKANWCEEHIGGNFFNSEGPPKTPLEQFTHFVNELCPQLD